jgi:group I intron endonuclease
MPQINAGWRGCPSDGMEWSLTAAAAQSLSSTKNPMNCGIYAITHLASGKKYIGSSVKTKNRLTVHRRELRNNVHSNQRLQNAWNKYGEKDFDFSQILVCSPEDKIFYEQLIIDGYNSSHRDIGFNISKSAYTPMHDREIVERIRAKNIGRPSKKKGIPVSNEIKEKCRESQLAKWRNPEYRAAYDAKRPTHCRNGHPFSGDNLYIAKDGERNCRACGREYRKSYRNKNRAWLNVMRRKWRAKIRSNGGIPT